MCTTQPSQSSPDGALADGWSECLISGFTKREILATPGFPRALPRALEACYRIVETPSEGLGIFASRPIQRGSLILSERAITIQPSTCSVPGPAAFPRGFTAAQRAHAALRAWEKVLEGNFARVAPARQAAFRALCNSHTNDGSGPLTGVVFTNSFGIHLRDAGTCVS